MPDARNSTDGVRIAYHVYGDGPPLFLFHGTATSGALWQAVGYVDALSNDHTVLVIDARGHGTSDRPSTEEAYQMDRLVEDVIAVLDAADVERADYFGYSFGGRVGFALGVKAPRRVRSLILGGASHRPQSGALDRVLYPGYLEALESGGVEGLLQGWSDHHGSEIPVGLRQVFLANDPAALVPYLRQTEREPGFPDDALAGIDLPVLLFAGEHDEERLRDSQTAAELLPTAELAVIPARDHLSTLTSVDLVLPVVRGFLDRRP